MICSGGCNRHEVHECLAEAGQLLNSEQIINGDVIEMATMQTEQTEVTSQRVTTSVIRTTVIM